MNSSTLIEINTKKLNGKKVDTHKHNQNVLAKTVKN
jgi:hypothetical protein